MFFQIVRNFFEISIVNLLYSVGLALAVNLLRRVFNRPSIVIQGEHDFGWGLALFAIVRKDRFIVWLVIIKSIIQVLVFNLLLYLLFSIVGVLLFGPEIREVPWLG